MRKMIVLGVLVAVVCGLVPAAWAGSSIPTCLISNGGSGGRFTKSVICVELIDRGDGQAGSGSYAPGDNTPHWLTVTVEYQPLGRPSSVWLPLATTIKRGSGQLRATTRPVRLPSPGVLRACTRAGTGTGTMIRQLCSISD
ncbi:MAG TPA: hypothetical protein VH352_18805 [Pseudonocardiaceae bacterium]|nr:hypothetical protein [Pseudonocardiaceae bacterium]